MSDESPVTDTSPAGQTGERAPRPSGKNPLRVVRRQGHPRNPGKTYKVLAEAPKPTVPPPFEPTEEMERFARESWKEVQDPKGRARISTIERKAGLEPGTVYGWNGDPRFREWITTRAAELNAGLHLTEVYATMHRCAVGEGSRKEIDGGPDRERFLKRFDPQYRDRKSVEVTGTLTHAFQQIEERARRSG